MECCLRLALQALRASGSRVVYLSGVLVWGVGVAGAFSSRLQELCSHGAQHLGTNSPNPNIETPFEIFDVGLSEL